MLCISVSFVHGATEGIINPAKYNNGIIHLPVCRTTLVLPVLAHEYVHHVQNFFIPCLGYPIITSPNYDEGHNVLMEGHARGVERECSKEWSLRSANPIFYRINLQNEISELISSYRWMCKTFNIQLNKHLISTTRLIFTERRLAEWSYKNKIFKNKNLNKKPTNHSMGNTLFQIKEREDGLDIYRKILRMNYLF